MFHHVPKKDVDVPTTSSDSTLSLNFDISDNNDRGSMIPKLTAITLDQKNYEDHIKDIQIYKKYGNDNLIIDLAKDLFNDNMIDIYLVKFLINDCLEHLIVGCGIYTVVRMMQQKNITRFYILRLVKMGYIRDVIITLGRDAFIECLSNINTYDQRVIITNFLIDDYVDMLNVSVF